MVTNRISGDYFTVKSNFLRSLICKMVTKYRLSITFYQKPSISYQLPKTSYYTSIPLVSIPFERDQSNPTHFSCLETELKVVT